MKKNIGKTDKLIRLIVSLIIAGLFFGQLISGIIGLVLITVTLLFVVTSFFNFCPIYAIFGINTCALKSEQAEEDLN